MVKKKRKIVWHKKGGKFIPSSLIKNQSSTSNPKNDRADNDLLDRKRTFAKNLSEQIKKAVQTQEKFSK